jgi:adenosylcobinamide kinase/adenosylcobinamide-phosphate guanylyltransferase
MKELVLGGARSGKSHYAQQLAIDSRLDVIYIATASADDAEMQSRIARHQADRPAHWQLIEEPLQLGRVLHEHADSNNCLLIDCLTLWLCNLLTNEHQTLLQEQINHLFKILPDLPGRIIFVSNETGLGVIPMGELSRRYCDEAGLLHQRLAQLCEHVTFMVAGLPQRLK